VASLYVLQSSRQNGCVVTNHKRQPKKFPSKRSAMWFKVCRGKWHWDVVPEAGFEQDQQAYG
jgi:hypothetical protein